MPDHSQNRGVVAIRAVQIRILAFISITLRLQIAPATVSGEDNTYLIKLKNGAEITCEKMSIEGDTLFFKFSAYGRKRVGINKDAIKAIFVKRQDHEGALQAWGKNILPSVKDSSQGPWE